MFSGLCFGVNYQMEEMGQAMALWGLLWFSHFLNISFLHVYRDSKIIIDHVSGKAYINTSFLQGWMKRIEILWKLLHDFAIQHIGRSQIPKYASRQPIKKKYASRTWEWYLEINGENNTYVMENFFS